MSVVSYKVQDSDTFLFGNNIIKNNSRQRSGFEPLRQSSIDQLAATYLKEVSISDGVYLVLSLSLLVVMRCCLMARPKLASAKITLVSISVVKKL